MIKNGRQKIMFKILSDENKNDIIDPEKRVKLIGVSVAIGGLIIKKKNEQNTNKMLGVNKTSWRFEVYKKKPFFSIFFE